MPSGWVCTAFRRHRGSLGRRQAKRLRDRSRWPSPPFERFYYSERIQAGAAADQHDHLLKLGRAELGRDLVYGALMQQQNSRDHVLANALRDGPAHILWGKIKAEAIHGAARYTGCGTKAPSCRLAPTVGVG
jgi:hypothetical protein